MIGTPELLVIAGVIVVLFGAKKLPELGRSVGEGIREFKKSTKGMMDEDKKEGTKKDDTAGDVS